MTKKSGKSQPLWMKALGALVLLIAGALGLISKDGKDSGESKGSSTEVQVEDQTSRRSSQGPAAPPSIHDGKQPKTAAQPPRRTESTGSGSESKGDDGSAAKILSAFRAQRSDMWLEGSGRVDRTLPDDNEGSRHQLFILKLSNGHTVKVAHNIDLAPRVPLERGDLIRFYGEYEWSERGGVVHWTHHDPGGRRKGGWLELDGRKYE